MNTQTSQKLPCSACSRDMHDKETNAVFIAVQIGWPDSPAFKRIYPELHTPNRVNICYVCWLKSLGMKGLVI